MKLPYRNMMLLFLQRNRSAAQDGDSIFINAQGGAESAILK